MARVLLLLFLVALAYAGWRLLRGTPKPPPEPDRPRFEPTARCARCGTHVPRDQLDAAGTCARCRPAAG